MENTIISNATIQFALNKCMKLKKTMEAITNFLFIKNIANIYSLRHEGLDYFISSK